jgi:hypothetical protein
VACRGVLFAITHETVEALLAAASDDEVREIVGSVEDAWDEERLAETDKAWDAMHRALSDGSLDAEASDAPSSRAILGGRHLYEEDDYIVSLVLANDVPEVARALEAIGDDGFRERYSRLVPRDYAPEYGQEDLDYTAAYFKEVVKLYTRAASEGLAVIFTVDQ